MADTVFRTFPDDKLEALTMLYLQNQDLSDNGITVPNNRLRRNAI